MSELHAEADATAEKAMPAMTEVQEASVQLSKVVMATESMVQSNQAIDPTNFLAVVKSIAARLAVVAETKASDAFLDAESAQSVVDSESSFSMHEASVPSTPAQRVRASTSSPPHEGQPSRRARLRVNTGTPVLTAAELRTANRASGLDRMTDQEEELEEEVSDPDATQPPQLAPPLQPARR